MALIRISSPWRGERAAFAPVGADLRFIGEREGTGAMFVQEELPEGFLAAQVLEAAPARRAFFEIEGRNRLALFVRDRQEAGLHRLDDRLVNGHDVEVGQAAGELERVVRRLGQLPRLEESIGQLLGEEKERRRAPAGSARGNRSGENIARSRRRRRGPSDRAASSISAPVSPKISPRERTVVGAPGRAFCGNNSTAPRVTIKSSLPSSSDE